MRRRRIWRRKEIQKPILTIKDLPDEIVLKILEETDVQDASSFSKIDKFSNRLIKNDNFLMEKVKTYVENMKVCGQEITNYKNEEKNFEITTSFENDKFKLILTNSREVSQKITFDHFNRFYRCFLNCFSDNYDDQFELIVLTYKKFYIFRSIDKSIERQIIDIEKDANFILSFRYDFWDRMSGYHDDHYLVYEKDESRKEVFHILFLNTLNDSKIKYKFKNFYVCTTDNRDIYIILDCPKYRGCMYVLYILQKFPTEDDEERNNLESLTNEIDVDLCNNFVASDYYRNAGRKEVKFYCLYFFNVIYDAFDKVFDRTTCKLDYQQFDQIKPELLKLFKRLS